MNEIIRKATRVSNIENIIITICAMLGSIILLTYFYLGNDYLFKDNPDIGRIMFWMFLSLGSIIVLISDDVSGKICVMKEQSNKSNSRITISKSTEFLQLIGILVAGIATSIYVLNTLIVALLSKRFAIFDNKMWLVFTVFTGIMVIQKVIRRKRLQRSKYISEREFVKKDIYTGF